MPPDAIDRLRLARTDGIGPATYARLIARYGSAGAALRALPGLPRAASLAVPPPAAARAEYDQVRQMGGWMLFLGTPAYPPALAAIADPPPVLSVLGNAAALSSYGIAIVGGRNASLNGCTIAAGLARAIASAGLVVTSGLARGIDAAAHGGALETGQTVAVVAGGLDCPYPREHTRLQHTIARRGAVVSETPLGVAPIARHFPRRNRIIAGLSAGVVLVEAALRSGSLITARFALESGRDIFAVPGSPLDPRCRGTNDLLRQGAYLTETAEDVLNNLPPMPPNPGMPGSPAAVANGNLFDFSPHDRHPPEKSHNPVETVNETIELRERILSLLGPEPVAVDDLIRRCQLSPSDVVAVLLELELSAHVVSLPGNRVALSAGVS